MLVNEIGDVDWYFNGLLMRRFIALNKGRLLIFERHRSRGQASMRFGWVDREGVLGGAALHSSQE